MTFAHPVWLLVGILVCGALVWMWRRFDQRQRDALGSLVAVHLQPQLTRSVSSLRLRVRRGLFTAAVLLLFVAAAMPQMGYRMELSHRRGHDVIFAVDTSRSMNTPDVKPSRLVRAKLAIGDLVGRLGGDAVGLVAFAGNAFLQCPMTLDHGAFLDSLNALDTHIIPRGGTNISSAIQEAQAALKLRPSSDKIVILVTDGEDLEGNALDTAKVAAQQGIKIYTVGVGTANGDLIPLPADQGGGFLKDSSGQLVKSRLDEAGLQRLAAATGGSYAPLGNGGQGLEAIYEQAFSPLARHDLATQEHRIPIQRFQLPLGAALLLLIASLLVNGRRRRFAADLDDRGRALAAGAGTAESGVPRRWVSRGAAAGAMAIVMGFGMLHPSHAWASSATQAYDAGNYSAAAHAYAAAAQLDPQNSLLAYNAGAAAYKAGDYPQATSAFHESLKAVPTGDAARIAQQEDAYYNLGNTLYRTGQKAERSAPQNTISTWTQAVKNYDTALQLHPADADAKFNRDFVNAKLEALKKQQAQNRQQSKSGNSQQQDKSSGGGNSSQQNKSQQDKSQQGNSQQGNSQQGNSRQGNSQGSNSQTGQPQQANSPKGRPQSGQSNDARQASQLPPQSPNPDSAAGTSGQQANDGQPTGSNPTAGDPASQADQRVPGQMSPEEARELLDSMKGDEHARPVQSLAQNGQQDSATDQPMKNW